METHNLASLSIEELRQQRNAHTHRLQDLLLHMATQGRTSPPDVLAEIHALRHEVLRLDEEMKRRNLFQPIPHDQTFKCRLQESHGRRLHQLRLQMAELGAESRPDTRAEVAEIETMVKRLGHDTGLSFEEMERRITTLDDLYELRDAHKRRLHPLLIEKARHGPACDPVILFEIDVITSTLERLNQEISANTTCPACQKQRGG